MRAGFLRGCGTALVTPFTSGGALDENALRALVNWQVSEGELPHSVWLHRRGRDIERGRTSARRRDHG